MAEIHNSYRTDLQGLRAIAILLIVLAHSSLGIFHGGFIGVDVFFVLSGFLITGLLYKELELTEKISLINFYARRLKRLLPALLFMVLVVFFLAYFLLSNLEFTKQLSSFNYVLGWMSNIYFAFREIDYFDDLSKQDLFLHTWSLGVEEQFYIIWPFVMVLIYKLKNTVWAGINLSLFLIFVISFLVSVIWTNSDSISAFYMMPSRIWQFTLGALIFFYIKSPNIKLKVLTSNQHYVMQGIGITLVISSGLFLSPRLSYPGFWALIPSTGAALIILAGAYINQSNNILSHKIFVWLGDHSYSYYLWHWPILLLGFSFGYKGQVFTTVFLLILALAMARISMLFIENPFWKGRFSTAKSSTVILTSILIVLSIIVLFIPPFVYDKYEVKNSNRINYSAWKFDRSDIYKLNCDDWHYSSTVNKCEFGNASSSKTLVFIGDSILAQWFSILPKIYTSPDWNIIVMTKSACPMIDKDYFYESIGRIYKECSIWRNSALEEIDEIKPDIAIIGNSANYEFSPKEWEQGSRAIIDRVSQAAKNVYVIPGTPSLTFDGPGCLSRNSREDGLDKLHGCYSKVKDPKVASQINMLEDVTSKIANVFLLNLNDLACPNGICSAITDDGVIVFRDANHLTNTFVETQDGKALRLINELTKKKNIKKLNFDE